MSLVRTYQKVCNTCQSTRRKTAFNRNIAKFDGLQGSCRQCEKKFKKKWYKKAKNTEHFKLNQRINSAKRRSRISKASFDLHKEAISLIYKNCPPGMHVDHIVPLRGENVCGLHVPDNLQYLTPVSNLKKGNRV